MPYAILRQGNKARPFQIVNRQSGKVVGTSETKAMAQASIAHRDSAESKDPKKYKRVVDNKMRSYGDTDLNKKIIRINKSAKKNKKKGDIIDTIVHEEMHVKHPKMHERTVRKKTKSAVKTMGNRAKQKAYSRYK